MRTDKWIKSGALAAGVLSVALVAQPAQASVTFAGASGDLAASAVFDIVGGDLQVVLTNTSTSDVLVPTDVLTAVYFDGGAATFSPLSATLTSGSTVYFGPDGGGNVGGEWAYASGLSGAPGGATQGISSTGLGLFGSANFGGPNLDGPTAVDGLNYGLLSAGDDTTTGNAKVTGGVPLIKNSVTFLLDGVPTGFALSDIGNVSFQYGTSLTEPVISAIPEPQTYAMLLAGLGLLGFLARRRARAAS